MNMIISVSVRTRITNPPMDASVIKGSTHVIQCGVTHDPSVVVTWVWHHGTVVIPANTGRRNVRRNIRSDGSLEIRAVRNGDIGVYMCTVTSSAGNDEGQANLKVIGMTHANKYILHTI